MRTMAVETTDRNIGTVCVSEMVAIDEPVFPPRRRPLRVVLNAIVETAPKFGSRVYLWELALALAKTDGVSLTLLVGTGQAKELPPPLRSCAQEVAVSAR